MKEVVFIASSGEDLRKFPLEVRRDIGYAFYLAQQGKKPSKAKRLKGFGGDGVLEITQDHDRST